MQMSFHTCKHIQCARVLEITYSAILVCELRLGSAYIHALSLAPIMLCISLVMVSTAICKVTPFSSDQFASVHCACHTVEHAVSFPNS